MNKRDMQQLKASIARDLVQGQGDNSATRDLLKQYVPLNGIVSKPEPEIRHEMPVENCLAPRATVAQNDIPAWHGATVAPHATLARHATVARYARVEGELRVPNTINFSLFPTLDPFAKAVYYQLFLQSYGFRSDTCLVSLPTLGKIGADVSAKGSKHNQLSRIAGIGKKAWIQARWKRSRAIITRC